jgi:hypothetical protein
LEGVRTTELALGASPVMSAVFWIAALIALSAAGVGALYLIRKWALDTGASQRATLTLAELRAMVARGEMTAAEFERARAAAIRAVGGDPGAEKTARALDGITPQMESRFRPGAQSSEEQRGGTGRATPANRRTERKPPPAPQPGEESGGPDR